MPLVAGVLLDHVLVDPAKRGRTHLLGPIMGHPMGKVEDLVELLSSDRMTGSRDRELVGGQIAVDLLRIWCEGVLTWKWIVSRVASKRCNQVSTPVRCRTSPSNVSSDGGHETVDS